MIYTSYNYINKVLSVYLKIMKEIAPVCYNRILGSVYHLFIILVINQLKI